MTAKIFKPLSSLLVLLVAHSVQAAQTGRLLPNAFGIAYPSTTTLLYGENPAGFANLSSFNVQAHVRSQNSNHDPLYNNLGLYYGNNSFGAGLSVLKQSGNNADTSLTSLYWGLGGGTGTFALGVGGKTTSSEGTSSTNTTDIGILFGARSALTIGGVVYTDNTSTYDFGAGLAYDFSPNVNFAADMLHPRLTGGKTAYSLSIHMGADIGEMFLAFNVIDPNNSAEEHIAGGLALSFSNSWSLQFMYNSILAKYLLGLTVRF